MPDEPARPLTPLAAGATQAWLDGVDLRAVALGSEPLLDRIYVAVRAHDWSTVPGVVTDLEVETGPGSFRVSFTSRHRASELDFVWHGRFEGQVDGTIECTMEGEARSEFEYCRIGFCVHHPVRFAGAAFQARTEGGDVQGRLPRLVAPQILQDGGVIPPIPHFDRLRLTSAGRESVVIESAGAPFELEDQRNWTDASFKSYIPPLRPGYPFRAHAGQRFAQHVRVHLDAPPPTKVRARADALRLTFQPSRGQALPAIGFGLPDPPECPEETVLERIAELRPDHLRLNAWIGRPDTLASVDQTIDIARRVGCSLEVALYVDPQDVDLVRDTVGRIASASVPVARWLVFEAKDTYRSSTGLATVALVRSVLDESVPRAVLAAGTASDFVWLNRGRTTYAGVDALTWAIQPSRHASDDRSILENAMAQGVTVETARSFAEGRALCVGPVELARSPQPADARQSSPLAAAWTVASLADLCRSAPTSITYFETAGPRGVVDARGQPFPVFGVFRELARVHGGGLRLATSSDRRVVVGLAVGNTAFVANLTPERRRIQLHGLDLGHREMWLDPYEVTPQRQPVDSTTA